MSGRREIRIAGAGGQGVVTAGRILAEAAILSGLNSTHSQSYGPQSRGGASRSDVVICRGEVGFPLVDSIDIFIALTNEAHVRYHGEVDDEACIIVDSNAVAHGGPTKGDHHTLDLIDTARSISGGQLIAGVVALGVVQALGQEVDFDALAQAVSSGVPPAHRAINIEALTAGMELACALTS